MSLAFDIKGWCPGGVRPMPSGDGLLVRVRPWCGAFTLDQANGLAEIAATAGIHPVYLCRVFKKRQRVTVGAFVRHLRIQRACDLLRNSQMPLAEIALQCGFADQSHFSVVFKRNTGVTPSAFRMAP